MRKESDKRNQFFVPLNFFFRERERKKSGPRSPEVPQTTVKLNKKHVIIVKLIFFSQFYLMDSLRHALR